MTRIDESPHSSDANADDSVTDLPPVSSDVAEGTTSSVYLPPFRIDVTVRPGVPHIVSRHRIGAAVRAALDAAGAPGPASIAIVLSADSELAQLNEVHMGASGPPTSCRSRSSRRRPSRPTSGAFRYRATHGLQLP